MARSKPEFKDFEERALRGNVFTDVLGHYFIVLPIVGASKFMKWAYNNPIKGVYNQSRKAGNSAYQKTLGKCEPATRKMLRNSALVGILGGLIGAGLITKDNRETLRELTDKSYNPTKITTAELKTHEDEQYPVATFASGHRQAWKSENGVYRTIEDLTNSEYQSRTSQIDTDYQTIMGAAKKL